MAEDRAQYPELKISVQNDGTVAVDIYDPKNPGPHDGKVDTNPVLREVLTNFRDWLNQRRLKIESEREAKLLGRLLYQLLFPADCQAKQLVIRKLKEARDSAKPICVQLEFWENQAELASLPWEFLTWDDKPDDNPKDRSFVAIPRYLILTRFVADSQAPPRLALRGNQLPVRILIVVCKKGGKTVAAKDLVKHIQDFARDHPDRIALDGPLIDPSYVQLINWLEETKNPPQIIHFVGHGRYNRNKRQGEVAMLRMEGSEEVDWVDEDKFQRLFTESGCVPRLLFLQLCEGAMVEENDLISGFAGLVPALISANVQAVVAMQFPIENAHAGEISKKFYDELTKGSSVGEAVQAARRAGLNYAPVAGFTPVLYMYGFDGAIVSAPSERPQTTSGARPVGGPSAGATPSRAPEPPSSPPPSAGLPTALDEILGGGVRKIKALKDKGDVTDEQSIALNRDLFLKMMPALRSKTVFDVTKVLAEHLEQETNTPLSEVLKAMLDVAGGLS